jgi:hypothetical protein
VKRSKSVTQWKQLCHSGAHQTDFAVEDPHKLLIPGRYRQHICHSPANSRRPNFLMTIISRCFQELSGHA